jgi:hypothetical protein
MLLLKTDRSFRDILQSAGSSVAIIPASRPDVPDSANVQCANGIAVAARASAFGVTVIEGKWDGNLTRELFVVLVGNEAQVVGFARKAALEADAAANWFLFRRPGDDLVCENADRSREACGVTDDGFTLADGHIFQFETAYIPAQFNTAWGTRKGLTLESP